MYIASNQPVWRSTWSRLKFMFYCADETVEVKWSLLSFAVANTYRIHDPTLLWLNTFIEKSTVLWSFIMLQQYITLLQGSDEYRRHTTWLLHDASSHNVIRLIDKHQYHFLKFGGLLVRVSDENTEGARWGIRTISPYFLLWPRSELGQPFIVSFPGRSMHNAPSYLPNPVCHANHRCSQSTVLEVWVYLLPRNLLYRDKAWTEGSVIEQMQGAWITQLHRETRVTCLKYGFNW